MTTIPDGLPTLSKGSHIPESGLACAMEYVSVLAGERFTDQPTCTAHYLAETVWSINDYMTDQHRHLLLPLLPRLVDANQEVGPDLHVWRMTHPQPQAHLHPEAAVAWLDRLLDEYDRLTGRTGEPTITLADVQAVGVTIRRRALVQEYRAGNIGEPVREYEFEPLPEVTVPEEVPEQVPEEVPV